MNNNKLSAGVKVGYGMGLLGEGLAMNTFLIYFLFFLTNAAGLDPGIAGIVAMVGVFWGAFTDLIAGAKSDASTNPNGKRRPFIFKAAIPLGVFAFLVYTDWAVISTSVKPFYFLIISMLFWISLSFADIPYLSFGSEITEDYAERTSLRSIANVINYGGMILSSSGTLMLVTMFSSDGGVGDTSAWSKTGLIFGILIIVSYWIVVFSTKGKEPVQEALIKEEPGKKAGYFKMCLEVLKIKPYRYILFYTILAYGGIALFTSMYIYYLYYIMYFTEAQTATIMMVYGIMVMIISVVLGYLKMEKKTVVCSLTILLGIGMCIAKFTGLGTVGVYLIFFLFALGVSAFFVQIYSMVYDICNIDEFISDGGRAGIIVSLFSFLAKIIGGVAMAVVGTILEFANFDATLLEQAEATQAGIASGTLLIPGVVLILGGLVMLKYPVNKKNFEALTEAIAARAASKEYSTEGFKELL